MRVAQPKRYCDLSALERIKYNVSAIWGELRGDAELILRPTLNGDNQVLEIAYDEDGYSYVRGKRYENTENSPAVTPAFLSPSPSRDIEEPRKSPISMTPGQPLVLEPMRAGKEEYGSGYLYDPIVLIPQGYELCLEEATPDEIRKYSKDPSRKRKTGSFR